MKSNRQNTILLIDDDSLFLKLTMKILRDAGYRDYPAQGNDSALAILERHSDNIGLIVQDCQRPYGRCLGGDTRREEGDSGIRFLREILRQRYPSIPVIFMTGDWSISKMPNLNALFLIQPFKIEELKNIVSFCFQFCGHELGDE